MSILVNRELCPTTRLWYLNKFGIGHSDRELIIFFRDLIKLKGYPTREGWIKNKMDHFKSLGYLK